jgi:hypothetical protein
MYYKLICTPMWTKFYSCKKWVLQLKGAKLEHRAIKAHSLLLDACTSCPLLRSDLETSAIEIKDPKHKLDHSSCYNILSPLCEMGGSLKGKLFHATK